MDATTFQFSLSVPRDPQFVSTVRKLAVLAARYASCGDVEADAFGGSVEKAVRACLQESTGEAIAVVVRRNAGPVEVLVNGRVITVEP